MAACFTAAVCKRADRKAFSEEKERKWLPLQCCYFYITSITSITVAWLCVCVDLPLR